MTVVNIVAKLDQEHHRAEIMRSYALHQKTWHCVNCVLQNSGLRLTTPEEYQIYVSDNARQMREYYK